MLAAGSGTLTSNTALARRDDACGTIARDRPGAQSIWYQLDGARGRLGDVRHRGQLDRHAAGRVRREAAARRRVGTARAAEFELGTLLVRFEEGASRAADLDRRGLRPVGRVPRLGIAAAPPDDPLYRMRF